ncbi:MAG: hypothetical protein LC754_08245 [Acidobacteria bacterium]|nr:hypothetical protein [Acidobacteriota bacterium]
MPPSSRKKKSSAGPTDDTPASQPLNPLRTGMPALDSITGVKEFRKGKKVYRIIETSEMDEYDKPAPPKGKRSRRR